MHTILNILVHSDIESLSPVVLNALHLPACTHLTNLTLRLSLIPGLHQEQNATMFLAATTLAAYASKIVQAVVLDILLDGSHVDLNRLGSLVQIMAKTFISLHASIPKSARLCIRWNGLQKMVKQIEKCEGFEEELCRLVQSHLSELGADGMVSFSRDVEDI